VRVKVIVEGDAPRETLDEIVQQIERNYILEVDRGELMETAIRAIVGKLEAHGGFHGAITDDVDLSQFTQHLRIVGRALGRRQGLFDLHAQGRLNMSQNRLRNGRSTWRGT
jgi:hypothetical protein